MSERKEITKAIERLELLEEKFGIAISGLYASYETIGDFCDDVVTINFDLSSLNGGKLERSFSMCASAYNSEGQLLGTSRPRIDVDDFMGFDSFSLVIRVNQVPVKIRLFPVVY